MLLSSERTQPPVETEANPRENWYFDIPSHYLTESQRRDVVELRLRALQIVREIEQTAHKIGKIINQDGLGISLLGGTNGSQAYLLIRNAEVERLAELFDIQSTLQQLWCIDRTEVQHDPIPAVRKIAPSVGRAIDQLVANAVQEMEQGLNLSYDKLNAIANSILAQWNRLLVIFPDNKDLLWVKNRIQNQLPIARLVTETESDFLNRVADALYEPRLHLVDAMGITDQELEAVLDEEYAHRRDKQLLTAIKMRDEIVKLEDEFGVNPTDTQADRLRTLKGDLAYLRGEWMISQYELDLLRESSI